MRSRNLACMRLDNTLYLLRSTFIYRNLWYLHFPKHCSKSIITPSTWLPWQQTGNWRSSVGTGTRLGTGRQAFDSGNKTFLWDLLWSYTAQTGSYRRFGTTYWSHLQGSNSPPFFLDRLNLYAPTVTEFTSINGKPSELLHLSSSTSDNEYRDVRTEIHLADSQDNVTRILWRFLAENSIQIALKMHKIGGGGYFSFRSFSPLNAQLNPICHLLALLGAHHILHVSSIRVKWGMTFFSAQIFRKVTTA